MMDLDLVYDATGVDWQTVTNTLREVGMAYADPAVHQRAFAASHTQVFAYRAGRLVGFGRALSDGVYQAAFYDIAVVPDHQKQGIGRAVVQALLARVTGCTVILYAAPGKEAFYQSLGLRRLKTGMALFRQPTLMAQKGFTA